MSGSAAKKVEKETAPAGKATRGLCSTCVHAPHCTYPRDPERPVLHCAEFEGIESPPGEQQAGVAATHVDKAENEMVVSDLKGLCRNCKHRRYCTYPKPERGVLECDEYE